MPIKKNISDKKLNRISTILEIIKNLGTIAAGVLGLSSAYVLNIQKFPVVIPGINFTLDLNFQFVLVICAMLAYIHFLDDYWKRNKDKLALSDSFMDFSFWELPRLKQPLLLIPIVVIIAVLVQISIKSYWLLSVFLAIIGLAAFLIFNRFFFYLSPAREEEVLLRDWLNDDKWIERWTKRIRAKLDKYGNVTTKDLYEVGLDQRGRNESLEIVNALYQYFRKYEFEEDLIFIKTTHLPAGHPEYTSWEPDSNWILLNRENLAMRRGQ